MTNKKTNNKKKRFNKHYFVVVIAVSDFFHYPPVTVRKTKRASEIPRGSGSSKSWVFVLVVTRCVITQAGSRGSG